MRVAENEAQEQQQNQRRQRAADEHVLLHQIDGGLDVDGFVIDLLEDKPRLRNCRGVQLRHGLLYARHGLDHVGAGLAHRVDGQRRLAELANAGDGLLVAEGDGGDIAHGDPADPARERVAVGAQNDAGDPLGRVELTVGANHVAALPLLDIAGRDRGVRPPERVCDLGHGEAVAGHARGIDRDPKLLRGAAEHIHPRHARHPLEALLDHVLHKIAVGVDRALVAGFAGEDEPGDRLVLRPGRADDRLGGVVRLVGHPIQSVGHQHERLVHIGPDGELQLDLANAIVGRSDHAAQPLEAFEHLLLLRDDLALDLGWRRAGPEGLDGEDRLADIGRELNRDRLQRDEAEHDHHQDRGDDCDRSVDGQPYQVHR